MRWHQHEVWPSTTRKLGGVAKPKHTFAVVLDAVREHLQKADNTMYLALRDNLWRRLPMPLRRALVLRVSQVITPRITRGAIPRPPLIVAGLLSQTSGLGAAARACHNALKCAGLPVYGIDLTTALGQKPDLFDFAFADGRPIVGLGTILLHVNGPLVPLALIRLGHRVLRDKRVIGHWFWELPQLPREWRAALPLVHDVFVNTTFVADAVRAQSASTRVHLVPYPLPVPAQLTPSGGGIEKPFTVLFAFNVLSNFARKNPCAVIAAFRRAFGDDPLSRLIIKHSNAGYWPESGALMRAAAGDATNIMLIGDALNQDGMDALYQQADVVMSLHRAEGLGLVIAEAMLRSIPVVATNWSGSTDFLSAETGVPIGYELVAVNDPQNNYAGAGLHWAEPDIEEAAVALRALRSDVKWRERLALAGAARAAKFFSPDQYVEVIGKFVGLHPAADGSELGARPDSVEDGRVARL